jgi:hypothetical protein
MSHQDPILPEVDPVEEELVAYLDEELEPEHRARVEHRLAEDGLYRDKLRHMQKSWDMLDLLARSEPDQEFTRTTVAMVALKAKDAVQEQKQNTQRQGLLFRLAVAAGTLACALISFGIGSWMLGAPDRQLVQDLPLIEQLDAYTRAESVSFLQLLDKHGLFLPENDSEAVPAPPGSEQEPAEQDSPEQRRERLEKMTPEQKETIYQRQQRFVALAPEEQQRLRNLYAEIEAHPRRDRLRELMRNYYDWLKVAPSKDQAEVLSASPEKRIAKIKEVQIRLATERLRVVASELSSEDISAISLWLGLYVTNHKDEFARSTPPRFKAALDRLPEHEQVSRHVRGILWRLDNPLSLPDPSEEELAALHSVVSPKARALLDEAETHDQKWQYAQEFIRQVQISKFFPRLSDEELRKFAETLKPEQREKMETMTAEEIKRTLRDMYYRQKASPPGGMTPWEAGTFGPTRGKGK